MEDNKIQQFVICGVCYTIVYYLCITIGDWLLFSEPISWKGNIIQAIFFGILMTAYDYFCRKKGWFKKKK